jgi:hypothetical protein
MADGSSRCGGSRHEAAFSRGDERARCHLQDSMQEPFEGAFQCQENPWVLQRLRRLWWDNDAGEICESGYVCQRTIDLRKPRLRR